MHKTDGYNGAAGDMDERKYRRTIKTHSLLTMRLRKSSRKLILATKSCKDQLSCSLVGGFFYNKSIDSSLHVFILRHRSAMHYLSLNQFHIWRIGWDNFASRSIVSGCHQHSITLVNTFYWPRSFEAEKPGTKSGARIRGALLRNVQQHNVWTWFEHGKHCNYCDHCVEVYDHHCAYVGVCIGEGNYIFFFLLLISSLLWATYLFGFSLYFLVNICGECVRCRFELVLPIAILQIVPSSFLGCWLCRLCTNHIVKMITCKTVGRIKRKLSTRQKKYEESLLGNRTEG